MPGRNRNEFGFRLTNRGVAQLGSALRSGRRGRWFESSHPDHFCQAKVRDWADSVLARLWVDGNGTFKGERLAVLLIFCSNVRTQMANSMEPVGLGFEPGHCYDIRNRYESFFPNSGLIRHEENRIIVCHFCRVHTACVR